MKKTFAFIGSMVPHIDKVIQHEWWKDWVQPLILSFLGAAISLLVLHYGKRLLHSFDNWRHFRKVNKFKSNGKA